MSYLLTGIIAIMITALALVAGVSYYDSGTVGSTATAKTIESKLDHGAEAVANFSAGTGTRPETLSDLAPLGLPQIDGAEGQGIDGARWGMACGAGGCQTGGVVLCVDMPDSPVNQSAATAAANKMGGSASGGCGSSDPFGTRDVVGIVIK